MLLAVAHPLHRLAPGVVLASVVLAAHAGLAFLARPRPGMILWTDGAGYLANARWLAPGVEAPYLDVTPFYHAGYSLPVAPLLLVTTDPRVVFTGFLVVNVAAAVAGALALWRLAAGAFALPPWTAALAAGLGSAYPAVLLQAGYEWAESPLFALVAAWALALWRLLDHPAGPPTRGAGRAAVLDPPAGPPTRGASRAAVLDPPAGPPTRGARRAAVLDAPAGPPTRGAGRAAVLAVVAVAAFATHGRAASLLAVTAGVLLAAALARRLPAVVALVGGAVLVAGTAGSVVVHEAIRTATRAPAAPGAGAGLAGRLLDPSLWGEIALRAVGQTWYLLAATLALAGLGAAVLGRWLLEHHRHAPRAWFAGALLAAVAVTVAVGAAGQIDPRRVDHHVYGRYLEMLAPLLLVAAAAGITSLGRRPAPRLPWTPWSPGGVLAALGVSGGVMVLLGATARAGYGADAFTGNLMPLNVLGILVWSTDRTSIDVLAVTGAALGAAVVVAVGLVAALRVPWVPVTVVVAAAVASAAVVDARTLEPFTQGFRGLITLVDAVPEVQAASGARDPVPIAYDLADRDSFVANGYVSELLGHPFRPFDSDRGERPASDLVIGSRTWGARDTGAALVYPETHRNQALWVRAGDLQDTLRARGLVIAPAVGDLPAAFFTAGLVEVADADRPAVRVTHEGGGAPWVRFGVVPGVPAVRLGIRWYAVGDGPGDTGGGAGDTGDGPGGTGGDSGGGTGGDSGGGTGGGPGGPVEPVTTTFADLPRTLLPGWSATVPLPLEPVDGAGRPLPPGGYRARIGLVVGDVWFVDRGAPELVRGVRLPAGRVASPDRAGA